MGGIDGLHVDIFRVAEEVVHVHAIACVHDGRERGVKRQAGRL